MSYPELSRGDRGDEVERLQTLLNRVGAMLEADGIFGGGSQHGVKYAQSLAEQAQTGTADEALWRWLDAQPEPFPLLHPNGIAFIAQKETGGLSYYEQFTRWPHFPGERSGITIGVGYDLRFASEANFRALWGAHLPESVIAELSKDIGKKGSKARVQQLKEMGIEVPFSAAWPVFVSHTLPDYYAQTKAIYPSLPRLPELCRSALVSLVYNRGPSLKEVDERRTEMRTIRDLLVEADRADSHAAKERVLAKVANELLAMRRLWPNSEGLRKRREAEAQLWLQGLERWV
ncbi:peptidoglycan-binding protein [Pontibacterium sp.]|uniref:peptidoglycan-binding protein n=1 Tax=Pontibacterium sp. TaxID=2036026 RepID=UPI003513B6EA